MIFRLFKRRDRQPYALYSAIVAQARQPAFYAAFGVPDSLDGRFDMIVLHAVLVFRRLRGCEGEAAARTQSLFDLFMSDMDRSLREMGVGDLTVPKRIKKMAEAFYGRLDAYVGAIDSGALPELQEAIRRNVFPDGTVSQSALTAAHGLACYTLDAAASLDTQDTETILDGTIRFPDPADFRTGARA